MPPTPAVNGGAVQPGLSAAYELLAFCLYRLAADKRYSLGLAIQAPAAAMKFFTHPHHAQTEDLSKGPARLVFASTTALEQSLDGTESAFARYFFALYHCGPDEDSGIVKLRMQLKEERPTDVVPVGDRFVLWGHSAFKVISSYYYALASQADTEEFRAYAKKRYEEVNARHNASQSLPVPIDLSEGQLSADPNLEFFACTALANGQVFPQERK